MKENTRYLVINEPFNPAGTLMSHDAQRELAAIARAHGIYVLSDEVSWLLPIAEWLVGAIEARFDFSAEPATLKCPICAWVLWHAALHHWASPTGGAIPEAQTQTAIFRLDQVAASARQDRRVRCAGCVCRDST